MKRSSCACSSVVEKADWPLWLGEADGDVMGLPRSAPEDALRFWRVDKKVGNVRNDGPESIEPVVPAEAALL
jgi:putative SOS response-associated peptidase YedK